MQKLLRNDPALLKEILPHRRESELRILALQLMQPFHHIMIEPGLYGEYLGADFFDTLQRAQKIEEMMDCVIREAYDPHRKGISK